MKWRDISPRVTKRKLERPLGRITGHFDLDGTFILFESPTVVGGTLATPTLRGRTRVLDRCTDVALSSPEFVLDHLFKCGASIDGSTIMVLQMIADENRGE